MFLKAFQERNKQCSNNILVCSLAALVSSHSLIGVRHPLLDLRDREIAVALADFCRQNGEKFNTVHFAYSFSHAALLKER